MPNPDDYALTKKRYLSIGETRSEYKGLISGNYLWGSEDEGSIYSNTLEFSLKLKSSKLSERLSDKEAVKLRELFKDVSVCPYDIRKQVDEVKKELEYNLRSKYKFVADMLESESGMIIAEYGRQNEERKIKHEEEKKRQKEEVMSEIVSKLQGQDS